MIIANMQAIEKYISETTQTLTNLATNKVVLIKLIVKLDYEACSMNKSGLKDMKSLYLSWP